MNLYILRGVSGSGKSTFSKRIKNATIHSTDYYFYKNGIYIFNKKKLRDFHQKNFEEFKNSIKRKKRNIIIDNTNLVYEFVKPYIKEAKKNNYRVILVDFIPKGRELHYEKNIHKVAKRVIKNQLRQYYKDRTKFIINVDRIIRIIR